MEKHAKSGTIMLIPVTGSRPLKSKQVKGGFGFHLRTIFVLLGAFACVASALLFYLNTSEKILKITAVGSGVAAICSFTIWWMMCSKPAYWYYLLGWQVSSIIGVGIIFYSACSRPFLWLGLSVVILSTYLFVRWIQKCQPCQCVVYKESIFFVSTYCLPAFTLIVKTGVLTACINSIMQVILYAVNAIILLLFLACVKFFKWSAWFNHI